MVGGSVGVGAVGQSSTARVPPCKDATTRQPCAGVLFVCRLSWGAARALGRCKGVVVGARGVVLLVEALGWSTAKAVHEPEGLRELRRDVRLGGGCWGGGGGGERGGVVGRAAPQLSEGRLKGDAEGGTGKWGGACCGCCC